MSTGILRQNGQETLPGSSLSREVQAAIREHGPAVAHSLLAGEGDRQDGRESLQDLRFKTGSYDINLGEDPCDIDPLAPNQEQQKDKSILRPIHNSENEITPIKRGGTGLLRETVPDAPDLWDPGRILIPVQPASATSSDCLRPQGTTGFLREGIPQDAPDWDQNGSRLLARFKAGDFCDNV